MNLCTLVDQNDNVIGYKERGQLEPGDIYRISALWVINSKDDVLLARRVLTKKNDPGKWSTGVAGTVENKESYEENIVREAQEELGITGIHFQIGPKLFVEDNGLGQGFFCQTYVAKLDWPIEKFKPLADEISAIKWVRADELQRQAATSPELFTAGFQNSSAQMIEFVSHNR